MSHPTPLQLLGCVLLEEADSVADRHDGLSRVVRDLDVEFFLERHHQLDRIKAVGAQVVDEVRVLDHLVGFDDKLLHAISDVTHRFFLSGCRLRIGRIQEIKIDQLLS
jgi:hypothetical protein